MQKRIKTREKPIAQLGPGVVIPASDDASDDENDEEDGEDKTYFVTYRLGDVTDTKKIYAANEEEARETLAEGFEDGADWEILEVEEEEPDAHRGNPGGYCAKCGGQCYFDSDGRRVVANQDSGNNPETPT